MAAAKTPFDSLRLSDFEIRRLSWAFAVSLAAHLLCWSGYELGKEFNLWQRLHWPVWLPLAQWLQPVKPPPIVQVSEPVVFVDVNPNQETTEAPKNAKYYSDKNSRAANPEADRESDQPKLKGQQTDVPKTEDAKRPDFNKLQPAPAPRPAESQPKPVLGDLTLLRPQDLQRQPPQERPRTLKEVQTQPPNRMPGVQMRQEGGVHRQQIVPSLDAKATPFGAYDRAFIEAVTQRWYDLLDSRQFALDRTGKVMLRFHLNHDGRVTDMRVLDNTVGDVLGYVCQKAVEDPAPYAAWPSDMRMMVGNDYRDITFTFYYY